MSGLYQQFCLTLESVRARHSRLVLGFSGGMDSRVLLDLLARYRQQYQIECLAVHVHHGLSPHADHWAQQCREWCREYNIPYQVEKVNLDTASGDSIEDLARKARYQALKDHLHPADILLTGQHSDDQLETVLLALRRGSGPKGLSAMAKVMPLGHSLLVRPLLSSTRKQIEEYARNHRLSWVEDESNQDIRYERNFIRHQIVPALSQRWPHIHQAVQRSAELCARQEALLNELLQEEFDRACCDHDGISVSVLAGQSELARAQLLRMWLAGLEVPMPSQPHLNQIWQEVAMARQDANPKLKLGAWEIRRFADGLYCIPGYDDVHDWQKEILPQEPLSLPSELGTISLQLGVARADLSLEEVKGPIWIGFEPQGLSAHPVGRSGSRKLKKLFQEMGVPSWQRHRIPILMNQDRVMAVADLFVDTKFAGNVYKIVWQK